MDLASNGIEAPLPSSAFVPYAFDDVRQDSFETFLLQKVHLVYNRRCACLPPPLSFASSERLAPLSLAPPQRGRHGIVGFLVLIFSVEVIIDGVP